MNRSNNQPVLVCVLTLCFCFIYTLIFNLNFSQLQQPCLTASTSTTTTNKTVINSSVFQTTGFQAITKEDIFTAEEQWYLVPSKVRNLVFNNYKLYLTSNKIINKHIFEKRIITAGRTYTKTQEIYINTDNNHIEKATIHEIGHALDHLSGFASDDADFIYAYSREQNNLINLYPSDFPRTPTSREYFAEAFSNYCKLGDKMQQTTPLTYKFIKNLIKNL